VKRRLIFIFFVILSFLFISDGGVFAEDYLIDSFDSLENWDFVSNDIGDTNSWIVNNGLLIGEVGKGGVSYLFSKKTDFSNFKIEFDAANISGVDQEFLFNVSNDKSSYFILNTRFPDPHWSQDVNLNKLFLLKYDNGSYTVLGDVSLSGLGLNLCQNNNYRFTILVSNGKIDVYIDGTAVLSFSNSGISTGGIGFLNWGGTYFHRNTVNNFDNLKVNSINNVTQTPTPTPTVVLRNKVIILPGLGASWNHDAIVYNQQVNDSQWEMTPFVNNYDGLIETLEKNKLERGKDFFVWNYDWRKPIEEISNKLNIFINENIGNDEKVDLVGHSLGGVVARIWSQDHRDDQRLDNLIVLGAPNMGSLDTYSVWNGGKVSKIKGIDSVVMQILLMLQNKGLVADLTRIRSYVPVIKDLLPTENYAIKNNRVLNVNDLESKNDFLINKNNYLLNNRLSLKSVVGIGVSTASFVKLDERSIFDKVLGLWPDGKLNGYNYDSGDGTVLESSAKIGSTELNILNSDHGGIVWNGIDFLVDKLNLEKKGSSSNYQDNFIDSLVFYVGSPAKLTITCGNNVFEENDGFMIIKNSNYNDCKVNLKPTENGLVHLVFGNTSNTDWNYLEKNVVVDKEDNFWVDFGTADIKFDKNNKDFLSSLLTNDFKTIGINDASKYFNDKGWNYLINKVFIYRKRNNKENIVSKRILDNLYVLSSINNKCNKRENDFGWIKIYKEFLNRVISFKFGKNKNLNQFGVLSFKNLEELNKQISNDVGNKRCLNYRVVNNIALGYGMEVLGN